LFEVTLVGEPPLDTTTFLEPFEWPAAFAVLERPTQTRRACPPACGRVVPELRLNFEHFDEWRREELGVGFFVPFVPALREAHSGQRAGHAGPARPLTAHLADLPGDHRVCRLGQFGRMLGTPTSGQTCLRE